MLKSDTPDSGGTQTVPQNKTFDPKKKEKMAKRAAETAVAVVQKDAKKARTVVGMLYKLRVGERVFCVGQTIVDAAGPQSLLADLVDEEAAERFVDRDAGLFKIVAAFLRTDSLPRRMDSITTANLRAEAAFFRLPTLADRLHGPTIVPEHLT